MFYRMTHGREVANASCAVLTLLMNAIDPVILLTLQPFLPSGEVCIHFTTNIADSHCEIIINIDFIDAWPLQENLDRAVPSLRLYFARYLPQHFRHVFYGWNLNIVRLRYYVPIRSAASRWARSNQRAQRESTQVFKEEDVHDYAKISPYTDQGISRLVVREKGFQCAIRHTHSWLWGLQVMVRHQVVPIGRGYSCNTMYT